MAARTIKKTINSVARIAAPLRPGRYKLKPVSMGAPLPGVDLNKANQLAGELEDEELKRKMELS